MFAGLVLVGCVCCVSYIRMADGEGTVAQHAHALGAVARGAVDLPPSAVADVAGGVGNLPTIDEHCRILLLRHNCTIRQSQIIQRITITTTWTG